MHFNAKKKESHSGRSAENKPPRARKAWKIAALALALVLLLTAAWGLYGRHQIKRLRDLSFREALAYTTKNDPSAVITVGILQNGEASYKVYGENGLELPPARHTYEIGSVTKTFTAALIAKAVSEDKLDMQSSLSSLFPLPEQNNYPSIQELLTHSSGFKGFYFERPMIGNFFAGRNDFCGISPEMISERLRRLNIKKGDQDFLYSNFGYAVLGLVLEELYQTDYTSLVNDFARQELGLENTRISDQSGDLENYAEWQAGDAYLAAGGLTSDISDMLRYADLLLNSEGLLAEVSRPLKEIDASSPQYRAMGIHMDEIGMAWIGDKENHILWHNGGTDNYNCYLGLDRGRQTAVVVLSNLPPRRRIPATILGIKLMEELRHTRGGLSDPFV